MKEHDGLRWQKGLSKKDRIFISGPMTGYKDYNFPLFNGVAQKLANEGFDVVNPVNICRKYKKERVLSDEAVFYAMIEEQQQAEKQCTTILLLPGWENSVGVRRELKTAIELNMKIVLWRN